ncbi:hypothetical protein PEX1_086790 [Penicillium expansum]|uniref:Uncharacterized protein n=1 Tax=Penicillium expansum TaxID=27334 RepID=A0A0A2I6J1_PENEN|nr:hypothetical protein PEX2_074240 [Penicillium expansum]KGO38652.1 hypothetical protein PEXP_083450 [Penicillium expansum]KGO46167.1 hypothetical protein PEX1_086790 [Penicillium expansum]KGO59444.1 hypothetical protein PEX2_074240 [Penicillium expansum]
MAGIYHPVCPAYCRDSNAWKTQLVGGSCGVLALALVLGAVVWIVRFHARQARLKNPQMVINEEYLQQKEEERKREKKSPWWQFRAKNAPRSKAPAHRPIRQLWGHAHVQRPDSSTQVALMAPCGLHLPHPPDVDPDVLSTIKSALKGKGKS